MNEDQRKRRLRRQNIISALIIVVGTILSYFLFGPRQLKGEKQEAPKQEIAASVETIILGEEKSKSAILERSAQFFSVDQADVVAEYSGKIAQVLFNAGDEVKAGQTLVIFEQSTGQNSPRVSLDQAVALEKIARENLSRTKDLVEKGIEIARNSVDIAEVQLKQAEAEGDKNKVKISEEQLTNAKKQKKQEEESAELQINAARLQLIQSEGGRRQAEIDYEKTIIKAPISGTITSKAITENEFFNFGNKVAQIVGDGFLQTNIYLNESQIKRISIGDEVVLEFSGKNYKGKVSNFSSIANSGNSRYEVRIISEEKIPEVANLSAKIFLPLRVESQNEDSFFVPLEAISVGQQKSTLFIAENGKAVLREVKMGETVGADVEVTEGLRSGEEVIIKNNRNLEEGQPIKIEK